MQIDPIDIVKHRIASTPVRMACAWLVGSLGAAIPVVITHSGHLSLVVFLKVMFFPIYMFVMIFTSGLWGIVAGLLFCILCWRLFMFLCEDGDSMDLPWIFVLSAAISLKASGNAWPQAGGIVIVFFVIAALLQRRKNAASHQGSQEGRLP